jgi:U3 small nucleolar ribonucleoprotein protein IMP3
MVRKLKYHEQKLLKKVDFLSWKTDNTLRESKVLRRYHVQKREDYHRYNKLCGLVKSLASKLKALSPKDAFRIETTQDLLEKLYSIGVIPTKKNLALCEKVTVSAFCRRRLSVVMVKLRMSQTVKDAVKFIEQGHVRVGPELITDPAFLVTRTMEDFVTWTNSSKIRKHVMEYNEERDDYDLISM